MGVGLRDGVCELVTLDAPAHGQQAETRARAPCGRGAAEPAPFTGTRVSLQPPSRRSGGVKESGRVSWTTVPAASSVSSITGQAG